MITIIAIIVPLMIISCIVSLLEISVNEFYWKFVNKNQIPQHSPRIKN